MKQELIVKIYTTTGVEHSLFRQKEMLDALAFHQDSYDTGDWPTRCSEFHFDEEEITYKEIVDGFLLFLIQFSDLIKFEKNNPSEISITIEMY
jgi:hypothetical protein